MKRVEKFKLESPYQATGDQPTAIKQLVDGLVAGEKEQTLLGVTGSGKSVVGSTKVFLKRNGRYYNLRIDSLDGQFSHLPHVDEATQYAPLTEGELQTVALDTKTGETMVSDVMEVSRHRYVGELYEVTTTAGHHNTFTDSHNVYILRNGKLQLVPSKGLVVGDFIPVSHRTPAVKSPLQTLDITEWISAEGFYVSLPKDYKVPVGSTSRRKVWAVQQIGERVIVADYHAMRQECPVVATTVGAKNYSSTTPASLVISAELMRFIGVFIAEGHATAKYVVVSTGDDSIRRELVDGAVLFGKSLVKRQKPYDYQINGKVIASLLDALVGSRAHVKHLPVFWPQLSDVHLGSLLSGVFAGDGCVEKNAVTLSTVSHELANDAQLALTRFGIQARVRHKLVNYKGEKRKSWLLSISGKSNLQAYHQHVGFGLERKDVLLQELVVRDQEENTNVDVMPLAADYVRQFMRRYGMLQRDVATAIGANRSLVSFYLDGKRRPSRRRAQQLYDYLASVARDNHDNVNEAHLSQLSCLANVAWYPITSIVKKHADTVVYDLSVPDKQTFLANGYFVHNTFSMANIIAQRQVPTLVLAHNKTLAAQLYSEFKAFFPENEVHYFVSYFDYYQPEAYIASSDTYIEKDSKINDEIDRLRHAATTALLTRRDTIIVASVSCIYGIGSPDDYADMSITVTKGERRQQDKFVRLLTDIQYQRNDIDFHRGTFRVRGDIVDVFPAGSDVAYRIEFFGDDVERLTRIDPLTGEILGEPNQVRIFPSSHYVTPKEKLAIAIEKIKKEFEDRMAFFEAHDKFLEAQRLAQRTKYDIEMLEETGFVKGIENYSRYLTNREPGEQPATLLDYFPDDFLLLVDESHMTLPQVRGMYNGDRARKEVLVEYGFRLPSALDNRPLTFDEFDRHINQAIYVSATPAEYELSHSPEPAQQVIRPTGLLDPEIEVRPTKAQIDDLVAEIRDRTDKHQRVLVTTLTKRMAEDLTTYLAEVGIKVAYIHSDIDTLERSDILRDLRAGVYDVLVGINLLREGLDLPEVSLVAIIDADKEGFLRSASALIQTIGRAARHQEGKVIMYGDTITGSMKQAIDETNRRRGIQEAYNTEHGITPTSVAKGIDEGLRAIIPKKKEAKPKLDLKRIPKDEYAGLIKDLTSQMDLASANLEFEKAAELRDVIAEIRAKL